ncbi:hypothetical protein ACHAXA_002260 [Cyclostephanos tholiformis]|uniref:Cell division cycle protein 123 n=1 Tax=Cyclostephanos tholiformis TaxID=382380 RepID=A0ABD3RSD1_9STRA
MTTNPDVYDVAAGHHDYDDDDDDVRNPSSPPRPTAFEVYACQFSSWYHAFRDMDHKGDIDIDEDADDDGEEGGWGTTTTTTTTMTRRRTTRRRRKNVTIESTIIKPLPADFVDYLLSDGVRLPKCATRVSSCMNDADCKDDGVEDEYNDDDDDDNIRWEDDDDDDDVSTSDGGVGTVVGADRQHAFPDLTARVQAALDSYSSGGRGDGGEGGGCFPKLNWSAPRDASWINCGTLRCRKAGDVYILLKSSDFIAFDLEKAWEGLWEDKENGEEEDDDAKDVVDNDDDDDEEEEEEEEKEEGRLDVATETMTTSTTMKNTMPTTPREYEYELVLRKWCNLHPSMEFRCFVYDKELVAISQRYPSKYYSHLQPAPSDTDDDGDGSMGHRRSHPYADVILAFFESYVRDRFADGEVRRYVLDVYLDARGRVWIVDFNVWGSRTDCLLFDWDELSALGGRAVEVRRRRRRRRRKMDGVGNGVDDGDGVGGSVVVVDDVIIPEMRVVTKEMKSMTYDPLSCYRGPTDVVNLLGGGGGDGCIKTGENASFEDFMKLCVRPSEM